MGDDESKSLREAITQALNDGDLEAAQIMIDRETEEMFPEDPMDFEITIELTDVVEDEWFDPESIVREWNDE